MEPEVQNIRLIQRAYWLIKLRWIAIVCLSIATFFCSNVLSIALKESALYCVVALLAVHNIIVLLLLNHYTKNLQEVPRPAVKKIINIQISIDLLMLTFLLHFSGGIENPFIFYFILHMIIASILLSVKESYLHATSATLLFGLLILLEYLELIPHHCLQGFVVRCLHRDGLHVLGTYFVFMSTLYLVVYMASYITTRLKQAEQAHRAANILLRKKDRIKDEYVSRVTHDIKGHLAAIQSCLDVVANNLVGPLNKEQADFIGRADNRTRQVTRFVKTLLQLTQMRLDDNIQMEVFSLESTINRVLTAVERKAQSKSIALNSNIEPSADNIFGNEFSIEEVITNLILNAIKYTPPNGSIKINTKEEGDYIIVEIIDTGIGIPPEELPKVFDEFYRATNAKKIEKDGTGLGLSIAKQIVERHGGKIYAESKENCGTRLWFTLPKPESV